METVKSVQEAPQVRKPDRDTKGWYDNEQNRRLIVVDENMFLMEAPEVGKWRIEVALITRGASLRAWIHGGHDMKDYDFIGRTWRPARVEDFAFFNLNGEHYLEDKHFEFDRSGADVISAKT